MSNFKNLPQSLKALSRREFLQYCGLGIAGLLLPEPVRHYLDVESSVMFLEGKGDLLIDRLIEKIINIRN